MTSNDNQQYVTVKIFRSELGEMRSEIRSEFKNIHAEIQAVRDIALVNSAKIDAHWEAAGMWFSVIAVLVAAFGCIASFFAIFRESHKTKVLTEEKVQSMIDASVNAAIAKALGVSGK
ncbi:MAG: hypothetical protein IJS39_06750 [Synergistaceae bacterium]|nr:hypothetical protein [Synergistaceae bacterium]